MNYEYIRSLQNYNQTLKLLKSDNLAMIASFFSTVFIEEKNITLPHSQILSKLDDYLYMLNQSYANSYPRDAKEYLAEFCSDKNAYLRKYHASGDEAVYELTPHTQKALEFLESLQKRAFVGSRSKLHIIFELLEDLEFETNLDDAKRIEKLQEQKQHLDEQIAQILQKQDIRFDSSRIKEHYMLLLETTRALRYDFSEIEHNFRELNTLAMEQIATREDAKSEVLGSIFDIEEEIKNQDQGKSFFAFWQLLTDATRSEKLTTMIENLYEDTHIAEFDPKEQLRDLKFELLQSGQKVSQVSSKLIEQLRRFIDERAWVENRRVLELCKSIEKRALEIKKDPPSKKDFTTIQGVKTDSTMPLQNSLYEIKEEKQLESVLYTKEIEVDLEDFYHQFYVDEEQLKDNIKKLLHTKAQCSLEELCNTFEITKGMSELVGYISIAKNSPHTRVDREKKVSITLKDLSGEYKRVVLPNIVFIKE